MLEQFKKDIKQEFEKYWERCDSVKNTNNKYFDESKYSKQFIDDIKRGEDDIRVKIGHLILKLLV